MTRLLMWEYNISVVLYMACSFPAQCVMLYMNQPVSMSLFDDRKNNLPCNLDRVKVMGVCLMTLYQTGTVCLVCPSPSHCTTLLWSPPAICGTMASPSQCWRLSHSRYSLCRSRGGWDQRSKVTMEKMPRRGPRYRYAPPPGPCLPRRCVYWTGVSTDGWRSSTKRSKVRHTHPTIM